MKNRMIPATLSVALVSTGVSCGTEPQELSPITGEWVSLAEAGSPALLELALLADSTDNNTIDGNLLRFEEDVELQLKRKRYVKEAG